MHPHWLFFIKKSIKRSKMCFPFLPILPLWWVLVKKLKTRVEINGTAIKLSVLCRSFEYSEVTLSSPPQLKKKITWLPLNYQTRALQCTTCMLGHVHVGLQAASALELHWMRKCSVLRFLLGWTLACFARCVCSQPLVTWPTKNSKKTAPWCNNIITELLLSWDFVFLFWVY